MNELPRLLAVVEVAKDDRIICQAEGCGHSVYKRIHVVRDNGRITAIGSECFKRLYGGLEQVSPIPLFGSSEGRRLSDEDRATLLENTERLLATLEAEHIQAEKEREAQRLKAEREAAEQLKAAASRILSARAQHRTQKIPPVIDILAGVPAAELAKIRIEATTLVQAENPGVNLEAPGWSGLVEAEIRRIVRRRRYGSSHG